MRNIDKIIVHCSFTNANQDFSAADIKKWHVGDNGWSDIGYHAVIRRDGTIEAGRPDHRPGAHARGHNSTSLGVCLVGGRGYDGQPEFNFTFSQISALTSYIYAKRKRHPNAMVVGHNEVSSKPCPCFDVHELLKGLKI